VRDGKRLAAPAFDLDPHHDSLVLDVKDGTRVRGIILPVDTEHVGPVILDTKAKVRRAVGIELIYIGPSAFAEKLEDSCCGTGRASLDPIDILVVTKDGFGGNHRRIRNATSQVYRIPRTMVLVAGPHGDGIDLR